VRLNLIAGVVNVEGETRTIDSSVQEAVLHYKVGKQASNVTDLGKRMLWWDRAESFCLCFGRT
jgi:hypothetical protein